MMDNVTEPETSEQLARYVLDEAHSYLSQEARGLLGDPRDFTEALDRWLVKRLEELGVERMPTFAQTDSSAPPLAPKERPTARPGALLRYAALGDGRYHVYHDNWSAVVRPGDVFEPFAGIEMMFTEQMAAAADAHAARPMPGGDDG
jgi:hypothetical protein